MRDSYAFPEGEPEPPMVWVGGDEDEDYDEDEIQLVDLFSLLIRIAEKLGITPTRTSNA